MKRTAPALCLTIAFTFGFVNAIVSAEALKVRIRHCNVCSGSRGRNQSLFFSPPLPSFRSDPGRFRASMMDLAGVSRQRVDCRRITLAQGACDVLRSVFSR